MPGVLILAGPTASGKTDLALALAERFDAEIVGADSRQIYRGMSIGTAAPTAGDRARVPHHLVEFLDPQERYNAARFATDAMHAIATIAARGKRAIVVGGTGFYVRALCGDVELAAAYDAPLRARLAREVRAHPIEVLHAWLAAVAPARAAMLAPTDSYRIVRALEIALAGRDVASGRDGAARPAHPSLRGAKIAYVKVALDVDVAVLEKRIASRVDAMLARGLIDEAAAVGSAAVAADAVGYPQIFAYLSGFATAPELRDSLARATRRYAKRQRTWFRSERDVRFASPEAVAGIAQAALGW